MSERLAQIEAAIVARLPDDADEFARLKAAQLARLQLASERMTEQLAAGRRVNQDKLLRLLNTIRRAERELAIDKPRPKPVRMPWQVLTARDNA